MTRLSREVPHTVGSVTDLAPSLVSTLSGHPDAAPLHRYFPVAPAPRRIILILIDGFGWDQWGQAVMDGLLPTVSGLVRTGAASAHPLGTVFPSMTPVVLTSLLTGLPPARHGILGQAVRLSSGVVDVLRDPWPDGEGVALPVPDMGALCHAAGHSYDVVLEERLAGGPLTRILHGGAGRMRTFVAASGLPVMLEQWLGDVTDGALYVYWPAVDSIVHARGAFGPEWTAEIRSLDAWIGRLAATAPNTWIWITADHGHVPLTAALDYKPLRGRLPWLPESPSRTGNGLGLPVPDGRRGDLEAAVGDLFGDRVSVHDVRSLWEEGLWGDSGSSPYQSRVGDVLLWAERSGEYWKPDHDHGKVPMWSHGGVSSREMQVPWIQIHAR